MHACEWTLRCEAPLMHAGGERSNRGCNADTIDHRSSIVASGCYPLHLHLQKNLSSGRYLSISIQNGVTSCLTLTFLVVRVSRCLRKRACRASCMSMQAPVRELGNEVTRKLSSIQGEDRICVSTWIEWRSSSELYLWRCIINMCIHLDGDADAVQHSPGSSSSGAIAAAMHVPFPCW